MPNVLSKEKRAAVAKCLVEGLGVRATCRVTGVCKPAVLRLLGLLGDVSASYQDKVLCGLKCERIECDEIFSFVGKKQANIPPPQRGFGKGDTYVWTAIDPDSKLVVCWRVGLREAADSIVFMEDLASRLAVRPQVSADGFPGYRTAVENAFGHEVDFGTEVKTYHSSQPMGRTEIRYSTPRIKSVTRTAISGSPDPSRITTAHNERNNLTMRMQMRRFTRLTNGYSRKMENHIHAVALHFMNYNFCQIHSSIRCTPAMAAGVANHVWELSEVINLLDFRIASVAQ